MDGPKETPRIQGFRWEPSRNGRLCEDGTRARKAAGMGQVPHGAAVEGGGEGPESSSTRKWWDRDDAS